ncbi:MAG: hypothetical protein ABIK37_01485 [candidate division WOR-3 bacterium]
MRFTVMVAVLLAAASAVDADSLYLGKVDTVGGTTYDWQTGGPALRRCCYSQGSGVYVVWLSSQLDDPYPDRNVKYNFWDEASRDWAFIEPDFMGSGAGIFSFRAGFGNLDVAPGSGEAWVSAHTGWPLRPVVANLTAGGVLEGPEGYKWPVIACGQGDHVHLVMMDEATSDGLWYTRAPLDTVTEMGRPGYVSYNLAASKVSEKVAAFWSDRESETSQVFFRVSTDAGLSWGEVAGLEPPPAYGQDTIPVFSLWGSFPFFDGQDRMHLVTSLVPRVRDTTWVLPAEIWHWCPENTPPWSRIHRAETQHLMGSVGYNAMYLDRPSIGEDFLGRLYVTWEQFDSMNVEPGTNVLRAGIWLAGSTDNGRAWNPALRITPENTVSHRFPCVVDRPFPDSVCITYMMDSMAGFYVQGQGRISRNPIVCQWVPSASAGIDERKPAGNVAKSTGPTVVKGDRHLQLPVSARRSRAVVVDAVGRRVTGMEPGSSEMPGLAPGVYFVVPESGTDRKADRVSRIVVVK